MSARTSNAPAEPPLVTVIDPVSRRQATLALEPDAAREKTAENDPAAGYEFVHDFPEGGSVTIRAPRELIEMGTIAPPCPVCGCRFLYRQRDFNRNLGFGIVVFAALVGLAWSGVQGTILPLIGCLVVASLIDAAIYMVLPEVVVCYRCLSCFRQAKPSDAIGPYDQHIADGFEFPEK